MIYVSYIHLIPIYLSIYHSIILSFYHSIILSITLLYCTLLYSILFYLFYLFYSILFYSILFLFVFHSIFLSFLFYFFFFFSSIQGLLCKAWLLTAYLPGLPSLCLLASLSDALSMLFSPSEPKSLKWKPDMHGIPTGHQEGIYSKHLVFTGGVSLACYVLGVVHFIFDRFGTEGFKDADFAGASSGSWAAFAALLAAEGAGELDQIFHSGGRQVELP